MLCINKNVGIEFSVHDAGIALFMYAPSHTIRRSWCFHCINICSCNIKSVL